jgi:hypothetical protein
MLVSAASQALAQSYDRLAINVYGGALIFDDGATENLGLEVDVGPIVGGRLVVAAGSDWRLVGGYGYMPLKMETSQFQVAVPDVDLDLNAHLFYGGAEYLLHARQAETALLLSAGAGAMVVDLEGIDETTDFMFTVAAGFTHPVNDRIAFRGEIRDHVVLCDAEEEGVVVAAGICFTDETLNHVEISGGLEVWLY